MAYRAALAWTLAFLAGSLWAAGGEAVVEDEKLAAARDLFERCVLAEQAEPQEQLEALEAVAARVDCAADAQGLLPLYRLALRSPRIADEAVALAVAEGLALCLVRTGCPFAEVRDALAREAEARGDAPVASALAQVGERFARRCEASGTVRRPPTKSQLGTGKAARPSVQPLAPRTTRAARAETVQPVAGRDAATGHGTGSSVLVQGTRGRGGGPEPIAVKAAARAAAAGMALVEAYSVPPRLHALGGSRQSARPRAGELGVEEPATVTPKGGPARPLGLAATAKAGTVGAATAPAKVDGAGGLARGAHAARAGAGMLDAGQGATAAARARRLSPRRGEDREALREKISKAASAALGTLVKELSDEADWMGRHGDHETALDILGQVVREAPDTEFSQQALTRAFALALANRKADSREDTFKWFERWAADRGGALDRATARLLVLQQRYRDGAFEAARDGLREFVKAHEDMALAPRARLLLALATWRAGDRDEAVSELEALVRSDPGHETAPRAQFLVGYLHFAAGDQERALAAFLRVVSDYPESAFAEKAIEFLGAEAAKRAEAAAEARAQLRARQLPSAECLRAPRPPRIDGRLDEAAWTHAPVVRLSHKGQGHEPAPEPDLHVAVRLLWDDNSLYVAFECTDDDIRSQATTRDAPVLLWDSVRVLIAPPAPEHEPERDAPAAAYFDLAVSPTGALCDGKVARARGVVVWESVRKASAWNGAGMQQAVTVDGSVNDPRPDRGWVAELAVPFAALGTPPAAGQRWRLNLVWVNRQGKGDRVVTSWAPLGSWLPQPRAFGRLTLSAREPQGD